MIPYLKQLQTLTHEILAFHQDIFQKYPLAYQAEICGFHRYIRQLNQRRTIRNEPLINGIVFYNVMIDDLPIFRVFFIENMDVEKPGVGSIELESHTGSKSYFYDQELLAQKMEAYDNLLSDDLLLEVVDLVDYDLWPKEVVKQSKITFEQVNNNFKTGLINLYKLVLRNAWKKVVPEGELMAKFDFLTNTNIRIDQ